MGASIRLALPPCLYLKISQSRCQLSVADVANAFAKNAKPHSQSASG